MTEFTTSPGITTEFFLEHLSAAAAHSTHPLARAACRAATARSVSHQEVSGYEEKKGFGTSALYNGSTLLLGSARFLQDNGIGTATLAGAADGFARQGSSTVWLAVDNAPVGVAAFADRIKESSPEAIAALRNMGINCIMLTGDSAGVAAAVANDLQLDSFEAELLPERKQQVVKELQGQGFTVGMVGDGINDAPALALADVGIAIGSGTDVAKETGDIILVRNDLLDVVRAIRLGKATLAKVRQNLFWALLYNVAGIPIAAGVLYPAFGILLKPEYAGLAMALSSVSVVLNSLLLKRAESSLRG
jgi:Cu+-exporting ATPase